MYENHNLILTESEMEAIVREAKKLLNQEEVEVTIFMMLNYETRARWWTQFIFWDWGQRLCGRYIAWLVRKKVKQYQKSISLSNKAKNGSI